jgi:hypothetical protein
MISKSLVNHEWLKTLQSSNKFFNMVKSQTTLITSLVMVFCHYSLAVVCVAMTQTIFICSMFLRPNGGFVIFNDVSKHVCFKSDLRVYKKK